MVEIDFAKHPVLAAHEESALDLIYDEFLVRELLGQHPTQAEYFARFPQWTEALGRQFELHRLLQGEVSLGADSLSRLMRSEYLSGSGEQTPTDAELAASLSVERFHVVRRLGAGTTGVVLLVHDRQWEEKLALKSLRRLAPENIERFKEEFRSLSRLSHANLVALYELFPAGDRWWISMEYIDGQDILSYLREWPEKAADNPARLQDCFAQLAAGLAALHAAGKIHGDIKPSNVLVTRAGALYYSI